MKQAQFTASNCIIALVPVLLAPLIGCNGEMKSAQNALGSSSSIKSPPAIPSPAPPPAAEPAPTPPPAAGRSSGCGKQEPFTGNRPGQMITVGGVTRSYQIIVPANYKSSEPIPLLFGFHYVNGTSANVEGENIQGYGEKSIYVFPQGLKIGSYFGWNEKCGGNDMNFVAALIDYVEANYCVNTNRLYAYGMSWGADMTNSVGCCLGSKFRALAPMSGSDFGTGGTAACTKPTPAYMLQYGSKDQIYSQSSFANIITTYRNFQGCSADSTRLDGNCISYTGCAQEVRSCNFPDLDHNFAPNFQQRVWDFFSKHK